MACQNQPKEDHYTIFSLSTKEQKATLHINGQTLLAEDNPTYLGMTFDKRLTWKQQTKKAEARAKVWLAPMKTLAGTTWGADTVTLKRLYTGRVRPVFEYGMTAWDTTAKSNFDWVSKVQSQAAHIITGAMKSTALVELETITGLLSLDDHRDFKLLNQAVKFKRLQDHPMRHRLSQPTKGRLKRETFIYQSRILERRQEDILDHDPKRSPHVLLFLPVVREPLPSFGVPSLVLIRTTPKAVLREEKVPHSGIPSDPLPERVLDSCVHWWLCWECSSKWRGRSLHPVPRRQRRQN